MDDILYACATIALHQDLDSFELQANGIFAAGKPVDGQVAVYRAKIHPIAEPFAAARNDAADAG